MKKLLVIIITLSFNVILLAQQEPKGDMMTSNQEASTKPFGFSLGLDGGINYTGLVSLAVEGNVAKNICIYGDAGLGNWGYKLTGGARFYKTYPKGIYYSASFSHSSGIDSIDIGLGTKQSPNSTEKIPIKLESVNDINLGIGYQWLFGNRFRIHLEAGYSIMLNTDPWKVRKANVELSETSKQVMNFMAPGGLMFGLGLSVGLY